jgi:hypothetical protein
MGRGVLYSIRRNDEVSGLAQPSEDAGSQGIRVAARCFVDRVGDNPLDGSDIGSRHLLLSWLPWCQHPPHLSGCRARGLAALGKRTHLPVMMLDLTEEETEALARLLRRTIDDDRYPLSPRVQTLRAVLDKIRPEPVREPSPARKVYAPPRTVSARRRRRG